MRDNSSREYELYSNFLERVLSSRSLLNRACSVQSDRTRNWFPLQGKDFFFRVTCTLGDRDCYFSAFGDVLRRSLTLHKKTLWDPGQETCRTTRTAHENSFPCPRPCISLRHQEILFKSEVSYELLFPPFWVKKFKNSASTLPRDRGACP